MKGLVVCFCIMFVLGVYIAISNARPCRDQYTKYWSNGQPTYVYVCK